jgi:hypothetical protein
MSDLRRIARYALVAVTALLALFVLAQIAQLAEMAAAVHPWFGVTVALLLLVVIAVLVIVPAASYARLEPPLVPPDEVEGPRHDAFVAAYLDACRRNPKLSDRELSTEEDLLAALRELDEQGEGIANRYASQVFVGTAVSQWGSLDGLVVAGIQARMVWEIAHVYHRRPSLRQMGYLYANVLITSVLASRLDQVDLSEYLRPVLAGAFGQSIASFPGVAAVSGQLSNALFQGSVNAFLTLRIAMVAIAYSGAVRKPKRHEVWRTAVARAGHLVFRTATHGSARVAAAFSGAAWKSVGSAAAGVGAAATSTSRTVGEGVARAGRTVSMSAVKSGRAVHGTATTAGTRVSTFGRRTAEGVSRSVRSVPERLRDAGQRLRDWRKDEADREVDEAASSGGGETKDPSD